MENKQFVLMIVKKLFKIIKSINQKVLSNDLKDLEKSLKKNREKASSEEKSKNKEICEVKIYFEKYFILLNIKENFLELNIGFYNIPKLNIMTERIKVLERMVELNKYSIVGHYYLTHNSPSYKICVLYEIESSIYMDAVVNDTILNAFRYMKKFRGMESPAFKSISKSNNKNIIEIDPMFTEIINEVSLYDIIDIEHVFLNSDTGHYCYEVHEEGSMEGLVDFIKHENLSYIFFYDQKSKNYMLTEEIIEKFWKGLKKLGDFKIYFKSFPVKSVVKYEGWKDFKASQDQLPLKLGFNKLETYIEKITVEKQSRNISHIKQPSSQRKIDTEQLYGKNGNINTKFKKKIQVLLDISFENYKKYSAIEDSIKIFTHLNDEFFESKNLVDEKFLVGKGGFGEIFENKYCGSKVAIKFIKADRNPENSKNIIMNEMTVSKLIFHKNIIKTLGWVKYKERIGIVMKYYKYGTLSDYLKPKLEQKFDDFVKKFNGFGFEKKLDLAIELGYAMAALHANNIVHFDLKPQNIYIEKHFHPIVADFGLALVKKPDKLVKSSGCSLYFCPPEQILNANPGPKCDVWSFGMTLCYIFTNKHPYAYLKKLNKHHLKDKQRYLSNVYQEMKRPIFKPEFEEKHVSLCEIMRECWNNNPDSRPTMEEVVNSLKIYKRSISK